MYDGVSTLGRQLTMAVISSIVIHFATKEGLFKLMSNLCFNPQATNHILHLISWSFPSLILYTHFTKMVLGNVGSPINDYVWFLIMEFILSVIAFFHILSLIALKNFIYCLRVVIVLK
jgi:hypothetical protein